MRRLIKLTHCLLFTVCITVSTLAQERIPGENPIIRDIFTADPAVLVQDDTVYLYVGHDEATGDQMFNINEWLIYSSTDMKNWTAHGPAMQALDFDWSEGNAWASQVIEKNGKFWFYTTTIDKNTEGDAIGVAVSESATGPFKDAIGEPLVVDSMTPTPHDPHDWDDIDPTAFTDDDGTTWVSWGNLHLYLAKLKDNMTEIDGDIQELYLPNFTEGPWLHKREDTYYLSYACFAHQDMWEKICYATAPEITGPWEYQGIITDRTEKSYTIHPAIDEFNNQWYFFYHTGQLTVGDESGAIGRRAVSIEYLFYNEDGTIKPITKTKEGISVPPKKPEEYKAPVFNPNGPLTSVESDLKITQGHGPAVREWPGSPVLTTSETPYQHAIHSESFNGVETGRPNAESIGQSFTIDEDLKLEEITLYAGDGFGISKHNQVTIALYDFGNKPIAEDYKAGENLLGDEERLSLNYKPQALGLYEVELPKGGQVTLKAGHNYMLELKGIRETSPVFWYRSRGDVYSGGAAFRDRKIIRDDSLGSDFVLSLDGSEVE